MQKRVKKGQRKDFVSSAINSKEVGLHIERDMGTDFLSINDVK
jgi:hypothetical protein